MYDTNLHESFFQYKMGQNKFNAIPCNRTLTDYQYSTFEQAIIMDYRFRLYIDGLPSAVIIRDPETGKVHKDYYDGIPVGKMVRDGSDGYTQTADSNGNTGTYNYILYNRWVLTTRV